MPKPWRVVQRQMHALRAAEPASPELTLAAQALADAYTPPEATPPPVELRVRLGVGEGLVLTTHTGREVTLLPTENGMWQLRDYLRYAERASRGQSPVPEPPSRVLADYERVCHCGRPRVPFDEPCAGCPGTTGAGKRLRVFTKRGREQPEILEDL